MRRPNPIRLSKSVLAVANERNIKMTAASVAFYTFNTAIPLALLVFVGLSYFGGVGLLDRAVEIVIGGSASRFQAVADRISDDPPGRWRAAAIAAGILLWSAFRMFRAVDSSFAEVYDERKAASLTETLIDTVIVLVAVIVGVLVVGVAGALLSFRAEGAVWVPYTTGLLFVVLLVAFLPMYYIFPRVETSVWEALPGAVLAATGWAVSAVFFRLYLSLSPNPYGFAGAVLLLLTWLYVGGLVLLLGVVLNAVLGGHVEVDYEWLPGTDEA
ncbi:YihY/virulence factor BrkB family protein [Salinirubrum litoreum]|uniref:YihY/virulence factor BrkB family protein n=1 Tax=Salinirubrum litoreum TaxID=1126234 RepID=A0ABD5RFU2_9EURY|nr:YhjD/YihY/BrkB family envelope integrity protein [Salinirubrum litoreum]